MGNKIARTTQVSASEYYLHDLPSSYNLVLIEVLGRDRFFKSILCKHDEGLLLVKVYFKRGEPLDLKEHERKLSKIRDVFRSVQNSHVWPFQFWLETDKAAYLLRQYFFSNLHDRLSMLPKLSQIEKKWLAFQLICAVKQSHDNGICHGDIKCENVLVTSWNWLYLADFASFKPTYIPDDDPSDFSFFFDSGGRRRCYLAPERFYEHGGEMQGASDVVLKPSMDIFSVGCVIAELFLGGQPLFELSQLLAYRRGQYEPAPSLEKIQDAGIRRMILHMIQLDPDSRLSCESYLQSFTTEVFPAYFSPFLHSFFACLVPLDSDTRAEVTNQAFNGIHNQMICNKSPLDDAYYSCSELNLENEKPSLDTECWRDMNSVKYSTGNQEAFTNHFQLAEDATSLLRVLEQRGRPSHARPAKNTPDMISVGSSPQSAHHELQVQNDNLPSTRGGLETETPIIGRILKSDLNSLISGYDSQSDTYRMHLFPQKDCKLNCEGMILIASLLCSFIRSVKQPQLRRGGLIMLKACSLYIDDEARLQHVLPYVVAMLPDPAAIVRSAALETLSDILPLVQEFPPSDAKIFPEYIIPMLSMLPEDPEESVRICYASNIFKIALTAYRLLFQPSSSSEVGFIEKTNIPDKSQKLMVGPSRKKSGDNRDSQLSQLRKSVAEIVQDLVMGPKQTPNIRRALLQNIGHLCCFFGHRQSNDFLLPLLPAFLNDRDEQLRAIFYEQIIYVCYFVGQRSVEEYLLPYIEQALSDPLEAVMVNALECITMLCKGDFLRKRVLLVLIERALPLLCYPIQWLQRSAISFVAASSASLGPVDSYVYLSPSLRPFLQREPSSLSSEASLLSCLKPPVSKPDFLQALENAGGADMLGRQRKIWYSSSPGSEQNEPAENTKLSGFSNTKKISGSKESNPLGGSYGKVMSANASLSVAEDTAKLRAGSYFQSNNGMADAKESTGRLHLSGFISPDVSSGISFHGDVPSEGIPVYSFSTVKRSGGVVLGFDSSLHWNSLGPGSSPIPWADTVTKSFNLSNSVPPKLFPGSFSTIMSIPSKISNSTQDNGSSDSDQSTYIPSKFQDIFISETLKGSASSMARDDALQADTSGFPAFPRAPSVPDAGWKPRGVLTAHLQEHRSAVNDITVSNDHSFFVSASDDSTVKIWDTRKLEKDISFRSRLTYPLERSRALCTAMLCGTAQVVVGSSDGTLHFFSVDYISRGMGSVIERYSGISDIKKKVVREGAILSLLNCSEADSASQTVMYSTQRCGIHLWDTRTNAEAWRFKALPEGGYISSLVMDKCGTWFVSGSSRGFLTLWDMRFLLPVNSWNYPRVCPVEMMCLLVPSSNSVSLTSRPLIYVAAGCNEISLWNAENGSCHQVLRLEGDDNDADKTNITRASLRPPPSKGNSKLDIKRNSSSRYRTGELNEPFSRLPGIRCLLPLPGGDLLTGGTDLRIRYWDHASPDRSYHICGPAVKGAGKEEYYDVKSNFGVQVVQETYDRPPSTKATQKALLTIAASDSAGCHRDSVLSLASVKLNHRLLISGSRDGAIKVWK